MKRGKTMIVLSCVLLALVGIIIAEKLITRHVDKLNAVDEIVVAVEKDQLTKLSWTKDEETLSFVRTDGVWADPEDAAFPVDGDKLDEFAAYFEELHASFMIEDVADNAPYGLDDPTGSVTLTTETDGEETSLTVTFGGYSTMDSKRYVTTGDGKVYLIDEDLVEELDTVRDDFMKQDVISIDTAVTGMTLSGKTELELVYDEEGRYCYTDSYNYYALIEEEHLPLKDSLVTDYIDTMTGLSLTDYVTYQASEEDLSTYGLAEPELTITLKGTKTEDSTETDVSQVVYIGSVTTPAEDENEEDTVTGYLRVGDSEIIYKLADATYTTLSEGCYNTLRPTEVFSLDWTALASLTLNVEGKDYVMTLGKDEDENLTYTLDGEEVTPTSLKNVVNALVIKEFDGELEYGQLECALTVAFTEDAYPAMTLELYRLDGDYCAAVLDGVTLGKVTRAQMNTMREAMLSLVLNLGKAEEAE